MCSDEAVCANGGVLRHRSCRCVVETESAVYVFEFKLAGNGSPEDAIARIREKIYAGKYRASGKPIVPMGASFDEEKRTVNFGSTYRASFTGQVLLSQNSLIYACAYRTLNSAYSCAEAHSPLNLYEQ